MRQSRGFTLVEILVVIVIIGILTSLVIVGVFGALKTSRADATRLLVHELGAACDLYRMEFGDYPPSTLARSGVALPNDLNNGIEALTACLSTSVKGRIVWRPKTDDHYGNVDGDAADRNLTGWYFGNNELREILDAWGRPLTYTHWRDYGRPSKYVFVAGGPEHVIKASRSGQTRAFANPDAFQVTSPGADGIPGTADDIVNW